MNLNIALILLIGVAAVGVAGGYAWHGEREADALRAANATADACAAALDSARNASASAQAIAAGIKARHEAAMRDARIVLDARDAQIQRLLDDAATRTSSIQAAAHDDDACAALDRLPVCRAVAVRLWPAAQPAADADHAH